MTQVIAFDIGGMRFRSGLVDESGHVTSHVAFDSPSKPDEVVEHVQRIVENYSIAVPNPVIGIAIGGMVEKNGTVTAGSLNMFDYPLEQRLGLKYPITILNDAKASALAEATYNPRISCNVSFMLMTISAGIGSGIIINGELYEGHTGLAGEVGHLIIDPTADVYCRLGHRGCLDSLASGRALNNRLHRLHKDGHWTHLEQEVTLRDLRKLLEAGDSMAHQLMRETGEWIGQGIIQIFRVLDPCEIIFKGYLITELWKYLQPHITNFLAVYDRDILMSLSSLGEHVGLIGASIAADKLRNNPITL